jgi:hypothetical protein
MGRINAGVGLFYLHSGWRSCKGLFYPSLDWIRKKADQSNTTAAAKYDVRSFPRVPIVGVRMYKPCGSMMMMRADGRGIDYIPQDARWTIDRYITTSTCLSRCADRHYPSINTPAYLQN